MRAQSFHRLSRALVVLIMMSAPLIGHATVPDPFIYYSHFIGLRQIPGTQYGTFNTAVRVGDAPTLQLYVHSRNNSPIVSVDLLDFGLSESATTSGQQIGYGALYYPAYLYNFGPLPISANVLDGAHAISITATGSTGNVSASTTSIIVDNAPPSVTLSGITFSTTSPKQGDYMYLSGRVDGTGSVAKVSQVKTYLSDAVGNPVVSSVVGGSTLNYDPREFNSALATSTDGSFSNVPIQLVEFGDIGWIARATNFRVDLLVYDEAGNFGSTTLTVPVPKSSPPDPCAAPGACASNVLFLPGIEASRLYRPDYALGTSKLWEPGGDADVRDLFMNASGASIRDDIYTRDVVDEAYGTLNIYKSFLADLDSWKNDAHIISEYSAVPYDWRVSLDDILDYGNQFPDGRLYYSGVHSATSTPYIIQELRRLASVSKTGKVTIVAHSNGGLVAKALIKKLQDAHDPLLDKIDSLIMVAVPQVGTPQAVGALLHGYGQAIPFERFHPFLSPAVAREFANTSPMAYHLLPSDAYFAGSGSGVETPVATFHDGAATRIFTNRYGDTIDNAPELHDFLLGAEGRMSPPTDDLANPSVLLPNLVAYGEGVHTSLDTWTPPASTTVHEIAGWGEYTVSGIIYDTDRKCVARLLWSCTKYEDMLRYTPDLVIDGDGTVVAPSALAMSTSTENVKRWWVDLKKYNSENRFESGIFGRDHGSILEIPQLRTFINRIITASSTVSLPTYISTAIPPSDENSRLRFFLHSPLALSATDVIGNEISAATSTIPGARYRRFGDVQYISVPADAAPTLRLNGVAAGSFTLEVQEVQSDNIIATTTFLGIPNATTTTAQMSFPDGTIAHASPLTVDADGDGDIDLMLQPRVGETVVPDTTPPELIITFATSTNALAFIGTDNMGSTTIATTTTYPVLKKKEKEPHGVATTSVIARDEAGNTTTLVYTEKLPSPKGRDTIILREIAYNGATTTIVSTALSYKWRIGKNGQYKLFASHLQTFATSTESHYSPKKNITAIMTKPRNLDDDDDDDDVDTRPIKERLPGMIIPRMVTENGGIITVY